MACKDKCLQICHFVSVHSKLHIYIYNAFLRNAEGHNTRLWVHVFQLRSTERDSSCSNALKCCLARTARPGRHYHDWSVFRCLYQALHTRLKKNVDSVANVSKLHSLYIFSIGAGWIIFTLKMAESLQLRNICNSAQIHRKQRPKSRTDFENETPRKPGVSKT